VELPSCAPNQYAVVGDSKCHDCSTAPNCNGGTCDLIAGLVPGSVTGGGGGWYRGGLHSYDPVTHRVRLAPHTGLPAPTDWSATANVSSEPDGGFCSALARFSVDAYGYLVADLSEVTRCGGIPMEGVTLFDTTVRFGCAGAAHGSLYVKADFLGTTGFQAIPMLACFTGEDPLCSP
jgi:hypothetical protein